MPPARRRGGPETPWRRALAASEREAAKATPPLAPHRINTGEQKSCRPGARIEAMGRFLILSERPSRSRADTAGVYAARAAMLEDATGKAVLPVGRDGSAVSGLSMAASSTRIRRWRGPDRQPLRTQLGTNVGGDCRYLALRVVDSSWINSDEPVSAFAAGSRRRLSHPSRSCHWKAPAR